MDLRKEKAADSADYCIACTSCIASCPVTEATTKFRGPKLIGPAQHRLHFAENDEEKSLEYCSNCKNCDVACPAGVAVSTLNMLQRAKYYRTHAHSLRDHMLAHSDRMAKLGRKIPLGMVMANIGMQIGQKTGLLEKIGISGKRKMPAFASKSFLQAFKEIKQKSYPDKVVFFPGCYINENQPQVGIAFVEVMQQNKYEVIVDESFVCCGSPKVVTGFFDEAKEHARINTERILSWQQKGYPVIACCTSCSLMLKHEYTELFHEEDMAKAAVSIYDAFEFLQQLMDQGKLSTEFSETQRAYTYHAPCHLNAQGIGRPAIDIMQGIPGIKVRELAAGCCGISGNYGFKAEKYDISMKVGEKLFAAVEKSKEDTVLSDCGTCRMQIAHGTGRKTLHPIEVLASAYKG